AAIERTLVPYCTGAGYTGIADRLRTMLGGNTGRPLTADMVNLALAINFCKFGVGSPDSVTLVSGASRKKRQISSYLSYDPISDPINDIDRPVLNDDPVNRESPVRWPGLSTPDLGNFIDGSAASIAQPANSQDRRVPNSNIQGLEHQNFANPASSFIQGSGQQNIANPVSSLFLVGHDGTILYNNRSGSISKRQGRQYLDKSYINSQYESQNHNSLYHNLIENNYHGTNLKENVDDNNYSDQFIPNNYIHGRGTGGINLKTSYGQYSNQYNYPGGSSYGRYQAPVPTIIDATKPISGGISGGTPGRVPGGRPGAIPGEINIYFPGSIPGGIPESIPGGIPGGTPGRVPGGRPGAIPGGIPGGTPGSIPESIPGGIPGGIPISTPGSILGGISQGTPGSIPGAAPGSIPGFTSEGTVVSVTSGIPGGITGTDTLGSGITSPTPIITLDETTEAGVLTTTLDSASDTDEGPIPVMIGNSRTRKAFTCGGVPITPYHVLTAAHCIPEDGRRPTVVRLGEVDFEDFDDGTAFDFPIDDITVHPGYNHFEKYNDIAIITLRHRVII
ncbi:unnamed protein product, partial [Meganyctiphanes norvegica]